MLCTLFTSTTVFAGESLDDCGVYLATGISTSTQSLDISPKYDAPQYARKSMSEFYYEQGVYDDFPWAKYRNEIKTIYVGEGVNTIAPTAFADMPILEEVWLPSTLNHIGGGAFAGSLHLNIKYGGSKTDWGWLLFTSDSDVEELLTANITYAQKANIKDVDVDGVKASYVYTGKAIKPNPTVLLTDPTGFADMYYTNKVDYTYKYAKNKNVGTATVTFTGINDFNGTKKVTFKILPKGTAVKKLNKPYKKQIKVTWNQQTVQTTGYQIQLATNSKFTSGKKTYTVKSNTTTAKTITKLASGKKYYVRIRTYKAVNGKNYCSAWSGAKSVTTR